MCPTAKYNFSLSFYFTKQPFRNEGKTRCERFCGYSFIFSNFLRISVVKVFTQSLKILETEKYIEALHVI